MYTITSSEPHLTGVSLSLLSGLEEASCHVESCWWKGLIGWVSNPGRNWGLGLTPCQELNAVNNLSELGREP